MPHRLEETATVRGVERRQHRRVLRHFREGVMAGRHLREVHVRFQADRLEGLESVCREGVVEVLGDRIGVRRQPLALDAGAREVRVGDTRPDPFDELAGHTARLHLLTELTLFLLGEDVIHPGKQGAKRETHVGLRDVSAETVRPAALFGRADLELSEAGGLWSMRRVGARPRFRSDTP
jgi:hypothetical protein